MNDLVGIRRIAFDINIDLGIGALRNQAIEIRPRVVRAGKPAGLPALIEQLSRRNRFKRAQIAKPRVRRVVPKNSVPAARNKKWNRIGAVVLPEIEVITLDVEQPQERPRA